MNQNPEQIARDHIDRLLTESGWLVQPKSKLNLAAGLGVAVTEYRTDTGPVDYLLFIDKKPIGVIEAKKAEEGVRLTQVEDQTLRYAEGKLKYFDNDPLHFAYESTGEVTRFTDYRDPKPRSRPVFTFHRPETFQTLLKEEKTLRSRLHDIPALPTDGLRDCQITAVNNLETSLKENRPKALIQMATGSGKTFTAITAIYRLLKFAKGKRILFLVDTKNLGEQAEGEFKKYLPQDDNRLFPELYGVTRLSSSFIPTDSQVYISTIQRLYSILKDSELDERDEQENPEEKKWKQKEPMPVVYNEKVPMEFFDFVVIDECHRSIYNLWKQVLDYFDAFQIGLTATPDNRTFGYFNQNLVCDYGYQRAVEDGVLVPYNVFEITTKITQQGARLELGEYVGKREKLTRKQFWNTLDEDEVYTGKQLDDKVVNPNQIRLIIQAVRDQLHVIFPDRIDGEGKFEVPKMLIFAKSDSHADDIINIVREEFAEENKFCKKITYKSEEDPKSVLQQFRNSYYPRVAVTVDMIATGTDIRPLEVLLFMRDVKSRTYYEQMKGRGTRTCSLEELRSTGTPAAKYTKDHFVIIDAIGVEKSQKTDSRPLEKKPGMSLKEVLEGIHMGHRDEDMLTTLANRLLRLDKQINEKERTTFAEKANGKTITQVVKELLHAHDPDTLFNLEQNVIAANPGAAPDDVTTQVQAQHAKLVEQATAVFNDYELRNYVIDVRKKYDQTIDHINPDEIVKMGWVKDSVAGAENLITEFTAWIEANKNEITALQIFYGQPYRRRELTYKMISELFERLTQEKPIMKLSKLWDAYAIQEDNDAEGKLVKRLPRSEKPKQELMLLVSLLRKAVGMDDWLNAYDRTVDKNFQEWVFKKQAGSVKFTEEQMQWLRMIKDYVASSFHVSKDDFDLSPFNGAGGLGKYYQLFKDDYEKILDELNEVLAA
jgi:type I restriction enzyme, R subunit